MTRTSFEQVVTRAFCQLLADGMTKESSITRAYFDDASVVLGATAFRARVNRDRGLVNIEIASRERPDEWFPLEWVMAAVTKSPPATPGTITLDEAASLIQAHSRAMAEHMTGGQAEKTLALFNQFAEERLDALERGEWPLPPE